MQLVVDKKSSHQVSADLIACTHAPSTLGCWLARTIKSEEHIVGCPRLAGFRL